MIPPLTHPPIPGIIPDFGINLTHQRLTSDFAQFQSRRNQIFSGLIWQNCNRVLNRARNHSSWLNQIEIVFGIIQRKCLRGGSFTSVPELESALREFIGYYNTTMAHPFEWTYTGRPLQKNRRAHFVPPHCRVKRRKPQSLAAS